MGNALSEEAVAGLAAGDLEIRAYQEIVTHSAESTGRDVTS